MRRTLSLALQLMLASAVVFVSGCSTQTYLTEYRYEAVLPEDAMIARCEASPPPFTPDEYVVLDWEQKEKVLTDYARLLLGDYGRCNVRFDHLQKWKIDMERMYNDKNKTLHARE